MRPFPLHSLSAEDSALLRRAMEWTDDEPDRETALWADRLAADVVAWCKVNRDKLKFRAPEIVKALTPYVDLHKVVDVVERIRAHCETSGPQQLH